MARAIVLRSPLTPVAIATTLQQVLGDRDDAPKPGVCGRGSEQDMMLFVYRPNMRNSFATSLTATMDAAGSGTVIAGKIGTPGSARIFMGCWFAFLAVFIGIMATGVAVGGGMPDGMWPMFAIPLGMMAFGALLYRLGTWSAAKDEAAILAFLATHVAARPDPR